MNKNDREGGSEGGESGLQLLSCRVTQENGGLSLISCPQSVCGPE